MEGAAIFLSHSLIHLSRSWQSCIQYKSLPIAQRLFNKTLDHVHLIKYTNSTFLNPAEHFKLPHVLPRRTSTSNCSDYKMASKDCPSPKQSVGPDYRPDKQKPTATVSTEVSYPTVHVLPQTPQLIALLTCVPWRAVSWGSHHANPVLA